MRDRGTLWETVRSIFYLDSRTVVVSPTLCHNVSGSHDTIV